MRRLTADFSQLDRRPYFLWDEDLTVADFREHLANGSRSERLRLIAKLLREAHEDDVWEFLTLEEVLAAVPNVASLLGRKRERWLAFCESHPSQRRTTA